MGLFPIQSPNQGVLRVLTLGVKWLGHEADHSPPPNAKVKNAWSYTSTAQWCGYVPMARYIVMHRDNSTFPFIVYI
jgi:hypothetical protein